MSSTQRPPLGEQITFLPTHDLARTADFYEQVLGLEIVLCQTDCRIYRVGRDAFVGFCQREARPLPGSSVILTLVTPDVDGWYHRVSDAGVAFERAPTHNRRYGIYHCLCQDPNGYTIEFQRFDDAAWNSAT